MNTFCTIITNSYLPHALTLYRSLIKFNPNESLYILVVDDLNTEQDLSLYSGIKIITPHELYSYKNTDIIFTKYSRHNLDALRWGLKPILLKHLLRIGYSKVIFTDCDIHFFNNYDFLLKELDSSDMIVTPEGKTSDPLENESEFLSVYKYGQFNAGFIGASRNATAILDWWSDCCAYKIEKDFKNGLYDDQKYLDALPALFEKIAVIRHEGCNIAIWNQRARVRTKKKNEIFINNNYPVIFIHFTNVYIPELLAGNDQLLYPYYLEYEKEFRKSGRTIQEFYSELPKHKDENKFKEIKRKLLLRTRLKRWLYKLSQ